MPKSTSLSPEYQLDHAACRELGHAWFFVEWRVNGRESQRVCRCQSCQTIRIEQMSAFRNSFRIDQRRYRYSKGYILKNINALDVALDVRRRLIDLAQQKGIRWAGGKWEEAKPSKPTVGTGRNANTRIKRGVA